MMLLWLVFGIVAGVLVTPAERGTVETGANTLAGAIVLSPMGAVLGLTGARRRDALALGLIGLAVGMGTGLFLKGVSPRYAAALGLIMGGVIGTTFFAFFYRLPRLVVSFLLRHTRA